MLKLLGNHNISYKVSLLVNLHYISMELALPVVTKDAFILCQNTVDIPLTSDALLYVYTITNFFILLMYFRIRYCWAGTIFRSIKYPTQFIWLYFSY